MNGGIWGPATLRRRFGEIDALFKEGQQVVERVALVTNLICPFLVSTTGRPLGCESVIEPH